MCHKNYSLQERLNRLVVTIKDLGGTKPVVFLDTGAIIDFDREICKKWRLSDSQANVQLFYRHLTQQGLPLFVTEGTLSEVILHHTRHRINGRPEISSDSFRSVLGMHADYCEFLRNLAGVALDPETVRYDVYWASKIAFPPEHKKNCLDPISKADRDLVAEALWARYTSSPPSILKTHEPGPKYGMGPAEQITGSVIISPDSHIHQTVRVLWDEPFDYNGLGVAHSREE